MDTTNQEKICLDCLFEELRQERKATEDSSAPEQKPRCEDELPAAGICDQEADTMALDEENPSAKEGADVCPDAVSDPASDKGGYSGYIPHDLYYVAISEVTPAEIELSRRAVVPQEVLNYYKQFGLGERIIKLIFQFQPPAMHPGYLPGISG